MSARTLVKSASLSAVETWVPPAGLVAVLTLYASLALATLRVPGVYYDELIQVVPALDLARGEVWSGGIASSTVSLFGHSFALMTMDYMGALKTLVFVPVVAQFGITPESVRLTTVAIGAASMLGVFAFARRLIGLPAALLGTALVGADPSFTYYVRVDYGPTALMSVLKALALWQLLIWWNDRHLRNLAIGALLFGLGVYDKANFLWIVAAVGIAAAIVAPRAIVRRSSWQAVLVGLACLTLGASPLIWFNLRWPMPTLAATAEQGGPTGGFYAQLFERVGVLEHLLDGEHVARGSSAITPTNDLLAVLVALAAFVVLVRAARRPWDRMIRARLFLLSMCILILVAAAVTPGGFAGHHIILTYPFPHLLVASTLVAGAEWLWPRFSLASAVTLALAFAALAQSWIISENHMHDVQLTGGTSNFSDAIFEATDVLESESHDSTVVSLDWGLHVPLVGLSQGAIHSVEMLEPTPYQLTQFFVDPSTRYVLHAPGATNNPQGRQVFLSTAMSQGFAPVREHEFLTRDGTPVIDVYVLERQEIPIEQRTPVVLSAAPNDFTLDSGDLAIATLTWDTRGSGDAELWVSVNGQPETLFARAASGSGDAPWIKAPGIYTFRLYSGGDHSTVLASTDITAKLRR